MTERDRALAVLDGRVPDRTPWYGDLSWWYAARLRAGTLPAPYTGADGYLRLHQEAGVGIYLYAPLLWHEEYDETVSVTAEIADGLAVTTIATPLGVLRSASRDLPESGTSAFVEHYVKAPADLRIVRHVFEHRRFRAEYEPFCACDAAWDDDGLACVLAPICTTGLQTLLTRWAGVETTAALAADAPEELERTVCAMQESDDEVFDIVARGPGRLVVFPENLSGEVTGRRLIRRYALPYWRHRIQQLHLAGKSVGIHNDGTLRASLPLLVEAGFDLVEAATPAPVGDMPLEEIRGIAHGRIIVWGGLPGALFSPLYPREVFTAFVSDVLRVFPPGSGFVLGVADQVPPDADFSRICLVRELVDRLG